MRKIIIILLFLFSASCYAQDLATSIFASNRKVILAQYNPVVCGDYLFFIARAESSEEYVAIKVAQLKLQQQLRSYYLEEMNKISFERELSPYLQKQLLKQYIDICRPLLLKGRWIEVVEESYNKVEETVVIVWAINIETIKSKTPNWQDVCKELCQEENFSVDGLDPLTIMEIAPDEAIPKLIKEYALRCQYSFGLGVKEMILGQTPKNFSIKIAANISEEILKDCRIQQLFVLMNMVPNHPKIALRIANRFRRQGLSVAAQMAASWGCKMPFLASVEALKCAKQVQKKPLFNCDVFEFKVDIGVFEDSIRETNFAFSPIAIYSKWQNVIPGGTTQIPKDQFFAKAQKESALADVYENYLHSIAENISFDGCYRAAEVAFQLNKLPEALFLNLQAAVIRPKRVEPWVNLANIAKLLRKRSVGEYSVMMAKKCRQTPWSEQQLNLLEQNHVKKSSTEKEM